MKKPVPEMIEQLLTLRRSLEAAQHGESTKLVSEFADLHGRSVQTIWRWLGDFAGYCSGRKKRADAGTTSLPEETLLFIAASKNLGVRANGKVTKPTCVAMNIADANSLPVNVSKSRINRILQERKLDTKSQAEARNHIQMRSLHPNHVHQIDPSLCLIYYIGKKQFCMTEAEFNKNKPIAMEKVRLKVWRYVRYDHASGSLDVRYFEAAGENQRSMFDFLLWTWGKQSHRLSYGIPKMLLWDKGSANTSTAIQRLLNALGVDHQTHATHHAWVKGGVEKGNHQVETHFESRLRDQPVDSIDDLNTASEAWVRDYNANAIKHVDSRIRRNSGEPHVRDDLWQLIMRHPGALIEMPERKVCAYFLTGGTEERTIRDSKISFVHPEAGRSQVYDLSTWASSFSQKDKVRVSPVLLAEGAIRVEIDQFGKEPLTVQVTPETNFDEFGRPMSAVLIGEEQRSATHTVAEQASKRLAQTAYGDANLNEAEELKRKNVRPFQGMNGGKGAIAHSHLGRTELPQRMLPAAQELNTPDLAAARGSRIELAPLNLIEAAKIIKSRIGDKWRPEHFQWLSQRYPDGVPEDHIESIAIELSSTDGHLKQPLRAVK